MSSTHRKTRLSPTMGGLLLLLSLQTGCFAALPGPGEVRVPNAIPDASGEYLSPYTSDGTVAPWVAKGRAAKLGSAVGSMAGAKAGEAALSAVPIIGGWLGGKAGDRIGREVALAWVGGEDYMRETSDLSFHDVDDLIVYTYALHSTHEDFDEVVGLVKEIYPEVEKRWNKAIKRAEK